MQPTYEISVKHRGRWISLEEFRDIKRRASATVDQAIKIFVYLAMLAAIAWIVIPGIWNIIWDLGR